MNEIPITANAVRDKAAQAPAQPGTDYVSGVLGLVDLRQRNAFTDKKLLLPLPWSPKQVVLGTAPFAKIKEDEKKLQCK